MRTLEQNEIRNLLNYDPETGVFRWRARVNSRVSAGSVAGSHHNCGYWQIRVRGRNYLAHRLAWVYMYGFWPPHDVDHVDRNPANNRANNLRLATRAENKQNTNPPRNNTTGVKGVYRDRRTGHWDVQIKIHRRKIHLGMFKCFGAAVAARRKGEEKYFTFLTRTPQ